MVEKNSICNGLQAPLAEDMHTIARRLPTPDVMVEDFKVIMYILILMKRREEKRWQKTEEGYKKKNKESK